MMDGHTSRSQVRQPLVLLAALALITYLLYLPAANAGWVTDTVDWQERVSSMPLWDYLNLVQTRVPSLYQFTQLLTWFLYKVLGFNHYPWHLLMVGIHVINAWLVYVLYIKVAKLLGSAQRKLVAFVAALSMCISPAVSEVIVWKASFHYLIALLLMLICLRLLVSYIAIPRRAYAFAATVLFAISAFSLELFYLTPWLVLSVILLVGLKSPIYRIACKQAFWMFFVPLLVIFLGHICLLRLVTGAYAAHLGPDMVQPAINYLRKAPVYCFHLLFLGRFWGDTWRNSAYALLHTTALITAFYVSLGALFGYLLFRVRSLKGGLTALVFVWLLMAFAIVSPVWVAEGQWVSFDRYAYIILPFGYYLVVAAIYCAVPRPWSLLLLAAFLAANTWATLKENKCWRDADKVMQQLVRTYPYTSDTSGVTLLLNLPDNYNGIPMISALRSGAFRQMYQVNTGRALGAQTFDVVSHNINSTSDGAHVTMLNDSTVRVTLNQWGTWWWYSFQGAPSYENDWYRVQMTDPGHWYDVVLKRQTARYRLLYQAGGRWRQVDKGKIHEDQY